MKTDYYCEACRVYFSEDRLPNIHKRHRCGSLARIVEHAPEQPQGNSED